tara:strand:+ start:429 stop:1739 length:1311 start_codon:yes stop_codon:yes gene_type:complete
MHQAIIAGAWQPNTDTLGGWVGPNLNILGTLDLSSTEQQSEKTSQASRGNGLWEVELPSSEDLPDGFVLFGTESSPAEINLDSSQRSAFNSMFGGRLPDDVNTLERAYVQKLTTHSDLEGIGSVPSLMPTKRNGKFHIEVNFGRTCSTEAFTKNHSHRGKWTSSVNKIIRNIVEAEGQTKAEQYAGYLFDEVKQDIGLRPDDTSDLIPVELRGSFHNRQPETTVDSDWSDLSGWTEETGTWLANGSELQAIGSGIDMLLHDTPMSSVDLSLAGAFTRNVQIARQAFMLRFASSSPTNFYVNYTDQSSANGTVKFAKYVNGSHTSFGQVITGLATADQYIKFGISGSTLEIWEGDASVATSDPADHTVAISSLGTATDTAHAGGLVGGMWAAFGASGWADTLYGPVRVTDGITSSSSSSTSSGSSIPPLSPRIGLGL